MPSHDPAHDPSRAPSPSFHARKPPLTHSPTVIPRLWFADNAVATHLGNGLNILFPAGERFFVRAVNYYVHDLLDPQLRADIRAFFQQEGRHANAHEHDADRLRAQGYRIDRFLRAWELLGVRLIERLSPPALRLAATAAAEHYTAIMAEGALAHDTFAEAHPEMRKLLLWHAAEEIEHKHVAFDVLAHVAPSYPLRVAGLLLATVNLLVWWSLSTTTLLAQEPLSLRELLRHLRAARGPSPILRDVFWPGFKQYLRRDFHPRDNANEKLAADYLATFNAA